MEGSSCCYNCSSDTFKKKKKKKKMNKRFVVFWVQLFVLFLSYQLLGDQNIDHKIIFRHQLIEKLTVPRLRKKNN